MQRARHDPCGDVSRAPRGIAQKKQTAEALQKKQNSADNAARRYHDATSFFRYDLITVLWFFAEIGSGLCYIVGNALGLGAIPIPEAAASPTFEYGNTFMFLAGLLNYLVIHDAFDIAAGRKR